MMIGKIGTQSAGINITAVNQGIAHKNEELYGKKQEESKITAVISPAGKKQSIIQQLMKQKQELTDRMNSLSTDAEKSGTDIKEQMKEFQKQMDILDEQIMKLQTEQEEKKEKKETSGIYEKPKSKEEVMQSKLNDVMSLSISSEHADIVAAEKDKIDGRTRVLETEVKSGYGNIEKKLEEISSLEESSSNLASEIGQRIQVANEEVDETKSTKEKKDTEDEEKSGDRDNSPILSE